MIHNSTTFYKNYENLPPTIRLKINNNGNSDETIMRFFPEATNDYDGEYDAFKLSGNNYEIPYIYTFTQNDSINLAINSLPEIDSYTVVPLGFKAGIKGSYIINTTELVLPDNITAYLFDKVLDKTMIINNVNSYRFYSEAGNFRNRFQIIFELEEASVVNKYENDVNIFSFKKMLYVNLKNLPIEKTVISISDFSGKKLIERNIRTSYFSVNMSRYSSGVYFAKIVSEKNIYLKKVIIF